MAENLFPQEYQAQLDEAKRRLIMAQMQQNIANGMDTSGRMVSGHFIAPHPLERIAKLVAQGTGAYEQQNALTQQSAAFQKYMQDQQNDLAKAVALTQDRQGMAPNFGGTGSMDENEPGRSMQTIPGSVNAGIAYAQQSQFPATRKLAEMLEAQRKDVFDKAAQVSTPESILASQGDPLRLKSVSTIVKSQEVPGHGQVTYYGTERGPQGIVANPKDNAPTKWGFNELSAENADLRKQAPDAQKNVEVLNSVARARELIRQPGFLTGFGADFKTKAQSFGALMGFKVPENVANQQELANVLLPQLTQTLRAVAPVGSTTERELKVAMEKAITSNFDPRAIEELLTRVEGSTTAALQQYNKRIDNGAAMAIDLGADPRHFNVLKVDVPSAQTPGTAALPGRQRSGPTGDGARAEQIRIMTQELKSWREELAKGNPRAQAEINAIKQQLRDFGADVTPEGEVTKRLQWRAISR